MITAELDIQADVCPGPCGLPLSQTIKRGPKDAENLEAGLTAYWKAFPESKYFAGYVECGACEVLIRTQKRQRKADQKKEETFQVIPEARLWTVYRNPNI